MLCVHVCTCSVLCYMYMYVLLPVQQDIKNMNEVMRDIAMLVFEQGEVMGKYICRDEAVLYIDIWDVLQDCGTCGFIYMYKFKCFTLESLYLLKG